MHSPLLNNIALLAGAQLKVGPEELQQPISSVKPDIPPQQKHIENTNAISLEQFTQLVESTLNKEGISQALSLLGKPLLNLSQDMSLYRESKEDFGNGDLGEKYILLCAKHHHLTTKLLEFHEHCNKEGEDYFRRDPILLKEVAAGLIKASNKIVEIDKEWQDFQKSFQPSIGSGGVNDSQIYAPEAQEGNVSDIEFSLSNSARERSYSARERSLQNSANKKQDANFSFDLVLSRINSKINSKINSFSSIAHGAEWNLAEDTNTVIIHTPTEPSEASYNIVNDSIVQHSARKSNDNLANRIEEAYDNPCPEEGSGVIEEF